MTDLLALCSDLPLHDASDGELLIEEGAPPGRLLVLVTGQVVVEHDGVPFARIDAPGAVFGEMSAVLDRPATATVRADGAVRVRVADDPVAFLTDHPAAALTVLRTTASRLDGMTRYLVDVKRQLADSGGHLGLVDQILDSLLHHQGPAASTGSARDPEGDHDHEADGSGQGQGL
ncbi:Crp/Fnr family transcriptional regulator [Nocardioides cynanchi]|uniref:Crp/Fnr family transcriptional regulator n=1 Tax=Nocardioides cynanchi TaxID=2558918 RepID=UPI00177CA542|nr:cyclic nucleotide-binding domain-containing protein [Nocardioides cynanchi]